MSHSSAKSSRQMLRQHLGRVHWEAIAAHEAALDGHTFHLNAAMAAIETDRKHDIARDQRLLALEDFRRLSLYGRMRWMITGKL